MAMPVPIPESMTAVLLTGHGGFDKLEYRTDVGTPKPDKNEVLIQVLAAGINNTDINTRVGWYSKSVTADTNTGGIDGFAAAANDDAGWSGAAISFPRIQGADCCGRIVAVGEDVEDGRIGERVLVRNMLRTYVGYRPYECWTFGSECDGAFAQFATAPARESYTVNCGWSDTELASIPCAYSTAEGMLCRASVAKERVLITGASGGVGSAAVQLCKRRGAEVVAVCANDKSVEVRALGADLTIDRNADIVGALGRNTVDVVIDIVAGPQFGGLLDVLRRGGRYATAGAIAGPIVELDVRSLYLNDLSFFGCTFQEDAVFENVIGYIERDEIRPVVAKTYPLAEIVQAQSDFIAKKHTGKLVLVPPPVSTS